MINVREDKLKIRKTKVANQTEMDQTLNKQLPEFQMVATLSRKKI